MSRDIDIAILANYDIQKYMKPIAYDIQRSNTEAVRTSLIDYIRVHTKSAVHNSARGARLAIWFYMKVTIDDAE